MIDTTKLTLIDGLAYALGDIEAKTKPEEWTAFSKWFSKQPHYLATTGTKCILKADLQMFIRIQSNESKKKDKTK